MKVAVTLLSALSICLPGLAQSNQILGTKFSPVVRAQYKTPWCYAMASRTLLDQVICEANQSCASGKAPDVAIAGVISAQIDQHKREETFHKSTEVQAWFSGGDQQLTLQEISQQGQITTGECTHEKDLFNFHQDQSLNPGFDLSIQLEIVFRGFQQSLAQLSGVEAKLDRFENARQWLTNLARSTGSKSALFLLPSLSVAKNFDEFIRLTLLPTQCRSKTITLPRFRVFSFSESDPVKIEARIDEALQKQRLVSLSICAAQLSKAIGEECGGHAVVVSQSRLNCSGKKCEKEYRFLDSSFFPNSQKNPDGSYWLPKATVIQATQAHAIYIKKTFQKIQDNFSLSLESSQSEYKKSILAFESLVINMKSENQKIIDQYRTQMDEVRKKTKETFSKLTPQQLADVLQKNPSMAAYYDDVAFEKLVDSFTKPMVEKMEIMRIEQEDRLKATKEQMNQIFNKVKTNFANSSHNIIWLE